MWGIAWPIRLLTLTGLKETLFLEVAISQSETECQISDLLHGRDEIHAVSYAVASVGTKESDYCHAVALSETASLEIAWYTPEAVNVISLTETEVVDYNEHLFCIADSRDAGVDFSYFADWNTGIYENVIETDNGYLQLIVPQNLGEVKLACGDYHSLVLTPEGKVFGCGRNTEGQLGIRNWADQMQFVYILSNIAQVVAGSYHSLFVTKDGKLLVCGANASGQLGNGSYSNVNMPVQVMDDVVCVSANAEFSAAIKTDGSLWLWGDNYLGQLGIGSKETKITIPAHVLDEVKAVSCGINHVLALKNDSTVWAWGNNRYGQLGNGTTDEQLQPTQVTALGSDVVAVATGDCHSAALKADGTVWTWGLNHIGQLGLGNLNNRNYPTQVPGLSSIVAIWARGNQTFALKSDGTLYAWGCNDDGQLGVGTQESTASPVQVDTGVGIASPGNTHALYLKGPNVFATGNNLRGQLGDGTTTDKLSPINVFSVNVYVGYWVSPAIDISQVCSYSGSLIQWVEDVPSGTTVTVETRVSSDGGANWQDWVLAANGCLVNMSGVDAGLTHALLMIRVSFSSAGNNVPRIRDLCCIFYAGEKTLREAQHYLDVLLIDSLTESILRNYVFEDLWVDAFVDNRIAVKLFEYLLATALSETVAQTVAFYPPEWLEVFIYTLDGYVTEYTAARSRVLRFALLVVDLANYVLAANDEVGYSLVAWDELLCPPLIAVDAVSYRAQAVDEVCYTLEVKQHVPD